MDSNSEGRTENCREVFEQLSAYLDEDLSPEARSEIERHLCDCPPCVEFVNSLRRTVELCHRFEPTDLPAPMSSEVRQRLLSACQKALASRRGRSSL